MITQSQPHVRHIFQQHASSFSFAAKWLPAEMRQDSASLYAFCRYCDDLADDAVSRVAKEYAKQQLNTISEACETHHATHPLVHGMLQLIAKYDLPKHAVHQLIQGVSTDLNEVRLLDEPALLKYAYQVAGTVGELMCPILGCRDPAARTHAVSLGIAMQLTNIVRDVRADAELQRLYLPITWLAYDNPRYCLEDRYRANTQAAMQRTLALAERYYQHASLGLRYLPRQPRLAIIIALRVYRAIGLKIAKQQYRYWHPRVHTKRWEKLLIATQASLDFLQGNYQHELAQL